MHLADTTQKRLLWAILGASVLLATTMVGDRGGPHRPRGAAAGQGSMDRAIASVREAGMVRETPAGAGDRLDAGVMRLTPQKEARLALGIGRDPFARGAASLVPAPAPAHHDDSPPPARVTHLPSLAAVSLGGGSALAVMDGRIVSVGDTVAGFVVRSIERGAVTVTGGGAERRIEVGG